MANQESKDVSYQEGHTEGSRNINLGNDYYAIFFFKENTDGVYADERTALRIRKMSGIASLSIDGGRQVRAGGAPIGR